MCINRIYLQSLVELFMYKSTLFVNRFKIATSVVLTNWQYRKISWWKHEKLTKKTLVMIWFKKCNQNDAIIGFSKFWWSAQPVKYFEYFCLKYSKHCLIRWPYIKWRKYEYISSYYNYHDNENLKAVKFLVKKTLVKFLSSLRWYM